VCQLLGERFRDWDSIPIDAIEKALIVIRAERQAIAAQIKDCSVMPVTQVDLVH
jgi:hypothetical protein